MWKIPLSDIDFGPEEEAAVLRVLRSRWLSMGDETAAFEREFAEQVGVRHAIAVANGTAALHLALLALEIGAGDAVLQPALNFVSAANMTLAIGAVPLFVDICSLEEPTLAPAALREALAAAAGAGKPRPRAVVVMHYGGHPCRMDEIAALCAGQGLALIEDACHAVGASYRGRQAGALGDVGCFSFFSNKNIATGEGGMVTTDRDDVAARVRLLRSHGMTSLTWDRHRGHASSYDVTANGFNYRIDEIRSAIGREQLRKLERNNERRRELTLVYQRLLAPLEQRGWTIPFKPWPGDTVPSGHLMTLVAPDPESRGRAAEALKAAGIQTSLHYPAIPLFTAFERSGQGAALPHTFAYASRVCTLPLYPGLPESELGSVCQELLAAC